MSSLEAPPEWRTSDGSDLGYAPLASSPRRRRGDGGGLLNPQRFVLALIVGLIVLTPPK